MKNAPSCEINKIESNSFDLVILFNHFVMNNTILREIETDLFSKIVGKIQNAFFILSLNSWRLLTFFSALAHFFVHIFQVQTLPFDIYNPLVVLDSYCVQNSGRLCFLLQQFAKFDLHPSFYKIRDHFFSLQRTPNIPQINKICPYKFQTSFS